VFRLSARARLTWLHVGIVLGAGVLLILFTYLLLLHGPRRVVLLRLSPSPGHASVDISGAVRNDLSSSFLVWAGVSLLGVLVLTAFFGWVLAGRVLRPVRVISATARRLSLENLSERVPVSSPSDELSSLALTINGMLERVQRGVAERDRILDSQRMFTAAAAHELRTPLATMRTAIDVTLEGRPSNAELTAMAGDVRTAVDHSWRTLDGLLMLARSQVGVADPRPVPLTSLVAAALAGVADPTVSVRSELRDVSVVGDPVLLERLCRNLLDNAVRHNVSGGWVSVSVSAVSGVTVLRVVNSGVVVPPDAVAGLTEPFVRGDRVRSDGAGLGLAIVSAIVAAHCGEIRLVTREEGGLDVTVRFPAPE
jgi:signal transduction histidine kinase